MTYVMWHKMQHIAALGSDEYECGPKHIFNVVSNEVFIAASDFMARELQTTVQLGSLITNNINNNKENKMEEMNTETTGASVDSAVVVVDVAEGLEVAVETPLLMDLTLAAQVREGEVLASTAIETLRDAVQRLSELQAAIDNSDFESKKAARIAFAEYREMLLRMRYVVNALRMEALEVRPAVFEAVGAAKKAGNVGAAERKVEEAMFQLAKIKLANGQALSDYEQSIFNRLSEPAEVAAQARQA